MTGWDKLAQSENNRNNRIAARLNTLTVEYKRSRGLRRFWIGCKIDILSRLLV